MTACDRETVVNHECCYHETLAYNNIVLGMISSLREICTLCQSWLSWESVLQHKWFSMHIQTLTLRGRAREELVSKTSQFK